MEQVFFTLLGRLTLNSFILYQQNTNHENILNQCNFAIQIIECLIGNYQETQTRPGREGTDIPKRLLNPETHMKQTKLLKGKKKKSKKNAKSTQKEKLEFFLAVFKQLFRKL